MAQLLAPKTPLVSRLLVLDGISRGGKFLLGKIVSSFENVEYFQAAPVLEHAPILHRLGAITDDAAVALLRLTVDECAYSMHIGRNLNTRFDDASSVRNSPKYSEYERRSLSPIPDNAVDGMARSGALSPFLVHEALPHAALFFNAYPDLLWISIIRDPVDVAHSWWMRGWGHRFQTDPLSFVLMAQSDGQRIPWYFHASNESYVTLSPVDRIIKSLALLNEYSESGFAGLSASDQTRVLFVPYEALVERTHEQVARISKHLGRPPLQEMAVTLARERCPAVLPSDRRAQKLTDLCAAASPEHRDLLLQLEAQYARKTVSFSGSF